LHTYDEIWESFFYNTNYVGKWQPGSQGKIPNAWKQYRSFLTQQNLSFQPPIKVAAKVAHITSKQKPKKGNDKRTILDQPLKKRHCTRKNSPVKLNPLHEPVVQEPKDDRFRPPLLGEERETSQDTADQSSDDDFEKYFSPTVRKELEQQQNT